MVKLHVFSGFENKHLGITDDMDLGHLYSSTGDRTELIEAGMKLAMKERWLQDHGSLVHFDLWGRPLEKAKNLFPIATDVQLAEDMEAILRRR